MRQWAELSRDLNVILNAGLSLGHGILISLTAFHPAKMEFASQIHTLNTVLATNWYKSFCPNETKRRMVAKTAQCQTREPELPAKDSVCRAGGTDPTDVTWDPQMLSRMTHRAQDAAVLRTPLFHNNISVILRFWIQGCPIPGSVPGCVRWDPEQFDPVNGHPAHDRGVGTWWSLRSYIPAKVILGFCEFKQLKGFPMLPQHHMLQCLLRSLWTLC